MSCGRVGVCAVLLLAAACGDGGEAIDDGGIPPLFAPDGAVCTDPCPVARGLPWQCARRFAYGTNWAWHHFGADFGGVAQWGQRGVAASRAELGPMLAEMKAAGVEVIRWWMFPRLFSDGIEFDPTGIPTGLGGTLRQDLAAALELAEEQDVYLIPTLFSFDGFAPEELVSGVQVRGLRPLVLDEARRRALVERVIAPIAEQVEGSPQARRVIAWDLINEPEWAMTGSSLYGDPDFRAQGDLEPVSHAQMEGFLRAIAEGLRSRSSAMVTVGSAAIKWSRAWSGLDLDFYQLHYYGWVYEWFPLQPGSLDAAGLGDRPVVMGELPMQGLAAIPARGRPALPLPALIEELFQAGYAGAWSWAYHDPGYPWDGLAMRVFPDAHACETRY